LSEERDGREKKKILEWKDYVAIVIAAFETTLLPILVFLAVLILVFFLFR
jgi:hypothetical protein